GIGPILLLCVKPWILMASIIILDSLWYLICLSYVSERLANAGIWINKLSWFTSPGMAFWFWLHANNTLAVISLIWQFLLLAISMLFRVPLLKLVRRP